MKLYLGSRDLKPEGFLCVDIDPTQEPDIVADIMDMSVLPGDSCSEIVASHVLEHMEWPDSFQALAEMSRLLRVGGTRAVAVPDVRSLLELIVSGENDHYALGLIFGAGGRANPLEKHRYGFTARMLCRILHYLGFGDFDWWNSSMPEGANGWCRNGEDRIAISLNVKAVKKQEPFIDAAGLYTMLCRYPMASLDSMAVELITRQDELPGDIDEVSLYQRIHFKLIDARQRIVFLEKELKKAQKTSNIEDTCPGI